VLASELDGAPLPFEFGRFAVHGPVGASAWVHLRFDGPTAAGVVADLSVLDASGAVVAEVGRLRLRQADLTALGRQGAVAVPDAFQRLEWPVVDAPAAAKPPKASTWAVVIGDDPAAASTLADALRGSGAACDLVAIENLHGANAEHVVHVWSAETDAEAAIRDATVGLAIARALLGRKEATRLWWVTRGAVGVSPAEDVAASAAAVWGLGRTLMHEHPELRCTLLDVARDAQVGEALLRELAA
jgi:hypothetical protein